MNVEATLYPAGLFRPFPPLPKEKPSPLAPPQVKDQCHHVHRVWAEDGKTSYYEKCVEQVSSGFLCTLDDAEVFRRRKVEYRPQHDRNLVDGIKVTETRAMLNRVGIVKRNGLTLWNPEVSMTFDPEPYYQESKKG